MKQIMLLVVLLAACNPPLQDLGDLSGKIETSPAEPVCVWNEAYIENYRADSIPKMVANASNCYVLIDPFDSLEAKQAIADLHKKGNTVGCYTSVGTCEEWRMDFNKIKPFCTSKQWDEWPGEFFVTKPTQILPLMKARVQKMADWGCDMVEFDNMDFAGESEAYDLNVSKAEGDAYNTALCEFVHEVNMGCMAKNYRVSAADSFDGGTFESFANDLDWWRHSHMQSFVDQGKLAVVFHYDDRRCEDVTTYYRLRYGSGVSLLCENPKNNGYMH